MVTLVEVFGCIHLITITDLIKVVEFFFKTKSFSVRFYCSWSRQPRYVIAVAAILLDGLRADQISYMCTGP